MGKLKVKVNNVGLFISNEITKIAEKSIKTVNLVKDDVRVDAKSILGILSLGLRDGDEIKFKSEDEEVLKELAAHFNK
jgi:phosphotransferase system HPr (HPr) family protein